MSADKFDEKKQPETAVPKGELDTSPSSPVDQKAQNDGPPPAHALVQPRVVSDGGGEHGNAYEGITQADPNSSVPHQSGDTQAGKPPYGDDMNARNYVQLMGHELAEVKPFLEQNWSNWSGRKAGYFAGSRKSRRRCARCFF